MGKIVIQQIESREDLEALQRGDVVPVQDYKVMRYHSGPSTGSGNCLFIGRKIDIGCIPALHFITIAQDQVEIEEGELKFNQPFELEEVRYVGEERIKYYELNGLLTKVGI
jgi:hypothetical protein